MKLKRRGLIGTIVYHILLILLLVFAGLTFPDPPPEELGILVNFGTDDSGFGAFEPKGDDQQAGDSEEPIVEETEEIIEEVVEEYVETQPEPEPVYTPPDPTPIDQTQDVEEVKVKEKPKPDPEEIERQRVENERIQREKIEQDRIEQERIEQERLERVEREKQERIEREKQAQAAKLNKLGESAFGKKGVGEAEGGQGITEGDGNQGDPDGTPDATDYGTGGGLGTTYGGLGSRKAVGSLPLPNMSGCEITQKIVVTVKIVVDQDGKVESAFVDNASYQDNCIWTMVVEAAKKSLFTVDRNANLKQTGWIKYTIVP
ncbi:MAG: hypothetical protein QNK35_16465 [Bacteroides sp.]|nr:hypothetical protein [Bacteroides sp.]